ncbi:hypothetical protein JMJ35_006599 [Cladonia borealis]|uniref:TLC domain-containing protein n=1 Tax=Cladonia borealis TaxID=184061 RepID=A0AA39V0K9_9LECA|nr:hypothetical protein JMJ35_006599 [Cladonia borealis]
MIDPLPAPPSSLRTLVEPIADTLGIQTLSFHTHEILLAFSVYYLLNSRVSPALSSRLFPQIYPNLAPKKRISWNVHVTSLFQSVFICTTALWVMWTDEERKNMNARERIWGYTGAMGMTQAFAAGYFAWDVLVSIVHYDVLGPGSLAHAISALIVTNLGFHPFANYYGIAFVLYELSTPFLNFNWFFDKCNMTGSRLQLCNGILLLLTFFGCRLAWGVYQTTRVYQDIWLVLQTPGGIEPTTKSWLVPTLATSPDRAEIMRFSGAQVLPPWLAFVYLAANTLLSTLNFYWFWLMIATVRKRFSASEKRRDKIATE